MAKYWVVGASWGGIEHQDQRFLEEGIWELGWKEGDRFDQFKLAKKMQEGDRIAIKRNGGSGKGKGKIRIFHLGIIKGIIKDVDKIVCTVNWVVTDVNRLIPAGRRNVFKLFTDPMTLILLTMAIGFGKSFACKGSVNPE